MITPVRIEVDGWPGSIVEFLKVVGPLTNPANDDDAFHVVCPSLPGYGFSDTPTRPGRTVERIARAWSGLMARLGDDRARPGHLRRSHRRRAPGADRSAHGWRVRGRVLAGTVDAPADHRVRPRRLTGGVVRVDRREAPVVERLAPLGRAAQLA